MCSILSEMGAPVNASSLPYINNQAALSVAKNPECTAAHILAQISYIDLADVEKLHHLFSILRKLMMSKHFIP